MEESLYQNHLAILKEEMQVALGCTEPIAIAYAAAKAREVLGEMPTACAVYCSGNIIKNVKAVIVPNSGGRRGMDTAAILGIVGGDASRELAVLETVKPDDIQKMDALRKTSFCTCKLAENVDNLYIRIELTGPNHTSCVEIQQHHTNITLIKKDEHVLLKKEPAKQDVKTVGAPDRMKISIENSIEFAEAVKIEDVKEILDRAIQYNSAISAEGLKGGYGAEIGKNIMNVAKETDGTSKLRLEARAAAAAGSDARMNGCALPVVINSGSGNQGITVTMPILVYAKAWGISEEDRYRALVLANLISVHQKKYIGSLSAYCGAASAATGSACGVAYMWLKKNNALDKLYNVLCNTITNSINTIGGMVCDGAKASCASKIGIAVENALMALQLANTGDVFQPGEGMTMDNAEETVKAVGRMAREGMKSTDVEILKIMLDE